MLDSVTWNQTSGLQSIQSEVQIPPDVQNQCNISNIICWVTESDGESAALLVPWDSYLIFCGSRPLILWFNSVRYLSEFHYISLSMTLDKMSLAICDHIPLILSDFCLYFLRKRLRFYFSSVAHSFQIVLHALQLFSGPTKCRKNPRWSIHVAGKAHYSTEKMEEERT